MPLTRGQRIVAVAIGGVIAGVALFATIALIAGSGGLDVRLGDEVFEAGRADRLARLVEDEGPVLFSDAGGRDRDIYVQHLDADTEEGWVAFDARPPGSARECFLEWKPAARQFESPCTDETFPADGGRLRHYRVVIDDDRVKIDFRRDPGPAG